jgi:hypothetical protein
MVEMKDRQGHLALLLLVLLAVPQSSGGGPQTISSQQAKPARSVTCSVSNPSYSGWCRVTEDLPAGMPGKKVCLGVLRCLNNIRCIKTYCNTTQIRGGWRLEKVDVGSKKN